MGRLCWHKHCEQHTHQDADRHTLEFERNHTKPPDQLILRSPSVSVYQPYLKMISNKVKQGGLLWSKGLPLRRLSSRPALQCDQPNTLSAFGAAGPAGS